MKKTLIGAVVGGLLIFLWQFLSFAALDLHRATAEHTPKQDSIINYLSTQFDKDGQYLIPTLPESASMEEMEKFDAAQKGKPWAIVSYHQSYNADMNRNMIRGLLVNIVMVALLIWILNHFHQNNFSKTLIASILVGLIIFLNAPYTGHIWYQTPGIRADLTDAIVGWGLCGVWLGWWLNKSKTVS